MTELDSLLDTLQQAGSPCREIAVRRRNELHCIVGAEDMMRLAELVCTQYGAQLVMMMAEDRAGELVEYGRTSDVFTNPADKRTEDYITGRFG